MNIVKWRGRIITLRCCRDWPCHESQAYGHYGRCGICRQIPEIIDEEYPIPTSPYTDYQQS